MAVYEEAVKGRGRMDRSIKILVALLIVGIVGFLGYSQVKRWHQSSIREVLEKESADCEERLAGLREEMLKVVEEMKQLNEIGTGAYEERLSEIFGEDSGRLSFGENISCNDLELQVRTFIDYLSRQNYMDPYKGRKGVQRLIREINSSLSKSPPMLSGEMEDLISLIRNVTHLYRQLGKDRIEVVKNILKNESDIIETVIAIFYNYISSTNRCQNLIINAPSQEVLYQYAGYFLNTLSGRSCLLRRDLKIRVLATYYSVLIVDKANDDMLNSYGIDIRPFIDYSFYEVGSQRGLIYQRQYLKRLGELKKKYQEIQG
jgi:hypothetical protein